MVKLISIFLSVLLVFLPVFSYAADEAPKTVYVKKGAKAPFAGSLLNAPAVAKILADREAQAAKCKENTNYLLARAEIECKKKLDTVKSDYKIDSKKLNAIIAAKNEEIKKNQEIILKASKATSPWVWAGIGCAVGVAATIGGVFLIKSAVD